jgi:hypothetical protein
MLRIDEYEGKYSLVLPTGNNPVDDLVQELGHEPNGPFWDGVAQWLVQTEAPSLEGRIEYDSEAGTFVALGDRAALEELKKRLAPYLSDAKKLRALVAAAEEADFPFDD